MKLQHNNMEGKKIKWNENCYGGGTEKDRYEINMKINCWTVNVQRILWFFFVATCVAEDLIFHCDLVRS